jgi:hypothetical protein
MAKQVFIGDGWSNVSEMAHAFQISLEEVEGCNFIVADYAYGDYDGSAYVLFEKDGKLYEVSGGHCSCYGLEGQWEPAEISVEALRHIMENGTFFGRCTDSDVKEMVQEFLVQQGQK